MWDLISHTTRNFTSLTSVKLSGCLTTLRSFIKVYSAWRPPVSAVIASYVGLGWTLDQFYLNADVYSNQKYFSSSSSALLTGETCVTGTPTGHEKVMASNVDELTEKLADLGLLFKTTKMKT